MKLSTVIGLRWLRRISQALFLCLFLWFLLQATYYSNSINLAKPELVTTAPINNFFKFDPLITFGHLISTHSLYPGLAFSLITIVATVLIGRFFCGWVCPFGTLHHIASHLKPRRKRSLKKRTGRGRYKTLQHLKYYILFFILFTSAFAYVQVGIFDPLCFLTRSFIFSVFPVAHLLLKSILVSAIDFPLPILSGAAEHIYGFLSAREIIGPNVQYQWALLTGVLLVVLLLANLHYTRLWCRFLCPLGALLALISRLSIVRMRKNNARCTWCGKCMVLCQGGSSPEGGVKWREPECLLCLNCQAVCPEEVMSFEFLGVRDAAEYSPDITRRSLITSLGAGLVALPLLRLVRGRVNSASLIRPPGALPEGDFLATCLRCGSCSRICPTNAIHPSFTEAGLEGLWTPRIVPRIGYCVYSCTLCGQVCPSQALRKLSPEEKMGSSRRRPVKIGTAVVNRSRCVVWSKKLPCLACEEVCPVSPKAIVPEEAAITRINGKPTVLKGPVVDSLACIGCGRCENVCPVEGEAAIRVFSVGESRAE
jgi:MauM/NapG family ferredoxin protein